MTNPSLTKCTRRRFLSAAGASLATLPVVRPARAAVPLLPQCLDFHFHAGLEREANLSMEQWVMLAHNSRQTPSAAAPSAIKAGWANSSQALGRSCFMIVDHLEFYRPELIETTKKYIPAPRYVLGHEGKKQFVAEVEALRKSRPDLLIFSGWEVLETDLDTGLDMKGMELVEGLGWHIGRPPDGDGVVLRITQLRDLQKKLPKPMVLYHPFRLPIPKEGETVASMRQLTSENQKHLIDALGDSSIYVELNLSVLLKYWEVPARRQAFTEDIRPLVEAGVEFTVGSDAHRLPDIEYHELERFMRDLGVRSNQVTGIVGDLLTRGAHTQAIPPLLRHQ